MKSFAVSNQQEVQRIWVYCWISRNLDTVSDWIKESRQEMCQPSSLMLSLSHAPIHTHTHAFISTSISSIILTHPLLSVSLHCWRFVMMSPSLPLKVDARGLSPQPDTPDTPVSPYLSSPDEVTATWGPNQALHPHLLSAPGPLLSNWSALANSPSYS